MTPTQHLNTVADPRDVLYTHYLGPLAADKYALTMASALFEAGKAGVGDNLFAAEAGFQMFVRNLPQTGLTNDDNSPTRSAYLLTAGLPFLTNWLEGWRFTERDIATLRRQTDPQGARLFSEDFLATLQDSCLELDIDAMPDGSLAFPHEPLLRIKGPLWQCLMVEAMVLNTMNACSNTATLAAQVVEAAEGRPVWEFGFRRAQDIGGLAPAYAAYVGGAAGTSNLLADKFFEIPAVGTMAHALVMAAEDEIKAFRIWAKGAPGVGLFLVDTYDTLEGVRHAAQVCREEGVKLQGIRLDSGNLATLSKEARKILDAAGFADAKITASNDLTPAKIQDLLKNNAPIDGFGVGTWLASAQANPALGGVYKLAAINRREVMKHSEEIAKATLPGLQDVLRFLGDDTRFAGDVLVPLAHSPDRDELAHDVSARLRSGEPAPIIFNAKARFVRPLQPLMRKGQLLTPDPTAAITRQKARVALGQLAPEHRQLRNPAPYPARIEDGLHQRWTVSLARTAQPR